MVNIKSFLESPDYKEIKSILEISGELGQKEGVDVFAVGGIVRDLIMGVKSNDIDIMVVGDGIDLAKKIANKLKRKKVVEFSKFKTAIIPNGNIQIEVASARKEVYKNSSRKPTKVILSDLEGDLLRRDFTINAMAINIHPDNFGELIDPFGGIRDIKSKKLKTPLDPDETFSEDPLRMIRAAYFISKLGFKIDNNCLISIRRQAFRIDIVSWERIRDEFIKILKTDKPSVGLILLQKTGLMKIVFPEIDRMYGMEQTKEWHHKDIFAHTLQVVDNSAKLSKKMEIRFAALVHDIAKPNTRRVDKKKGYTFHGHDAVGERMLNKVSKRMKLSNNLTRYLKKLTRLHLRPIALVKDSVTDSAIRRLIVSSGDDLEDLMTLCRADITTKNPKRVDRYLKNFDLVEKKIKKVIETDEQRLFQSPIKGNEIMELCGLSEGRKVGIIKRAIEAAILDGLIENDYESSLKYLNTIKKDFI